MRYRSLPARDPRRAGALLVTALAPPLSAVLLWCLLRPGPGAGPRPERRGGWAVVLDHVLLGAAGGLALHLLVGGAWVAHAMAVARDPVPEAPERGTRVALLTTYTPGREQLAEQLAAVRATLEGVDGAVRPRYDGPLDVWLLDEGDGEEARALCAELGARHFSRRGVPEWNSPGGPHKTGSAHGNLNAWLAMHGDLYDVLAVVGTGHVPLPGFLERTLGHFRDPDVAFVVGPRMYGNRASPLTRAAEAQQFLHEGLIQRAGNRYGAPLLVGADRVVRVSALRQAGGFHDAAAEDLATGFEIHRRRNPHTGRFWRSVHTPDALAVGAGPESWTDFFAQQLRRSRGTCETLGRYRAALLRMPPGRLLGYALMLVHYPMNAVNWLLGAVGSVLLLRLGASGVLASPVVWPACCGAVAALVAGRCLWHRRDGAPSRRSGGSGHPLRRSGASGHLLRRSAGSGGLAGLGMSALAAPVHLRSLASAPARTRRGSAARPEGGASGPDRLVTFRSHLLWAKLLGASLVASAFLGHAGAATRTGAVLLLALSLAPVAIWLWTDRRQRIAARLGAVLRGRPDRAGAPGTLRRRPRLSRLSRVRRGPSRAQPVRQPRGATTFRTARLRTPPGPIAPGTPIARGQTWPAPSVDPSGPVAGPPSADGPGRLL